MSTGGCNINVLLADGCSNSVPLHKASVRCAVRLLLCPDPCVTDCRGTSYKFIDVTLPTKVDVLLQFQQQQHQLWLSTEKVFALIDMLGHGTHIKIQSMK